MTILSSLFPSGPFGDPKLWDTIKVGGQTWYGLFKIQGAGRLYKWDTKDAAGVEGASQTYRGKKPKRFRITFYIWTDDFWTQWQQGFAENFKYSGLKGDVKPVEIFHPSLDAIDVSQVICIDLGAVERVSDDGMWAAVVELEEFFPQTIGNATTSPTAAKVSPPALPGIPADPVAAQLQAQLAAQYLIAIQNGFPSPAPPPAGSGLQ
jgi:hypothetical protein